jgi:uncharacterized protein YwqG
LQYIAKEDPFRVFNSEEAIVKLEKYHGKKVHVFSLDADDMYYNLNIEYLMKAVEELIVEKGITQFQEKIGLSALDFLRLL